LRNTVEFRAFVLERYNKISYIATRQKGKRKWHSTLNENNVLMNHTKIKVTF